MVVKEATAVICALEKEENDVSHVEELDMTLSLISNVVCVLDVVIKIVSFVMALGIETVLVVGGEE